MCTTVMTQLSQFQIKMHGINMSFLLIYNKIPQVLHDIFGKERFILMLLTQTA
jgi:hypothetical protein